MLSKQDIGLNNSGNCNILDALYCVLCIMKQAGKALTILGLVLVQWIPRLLKCFRTDKKSGIRNTKRYHFLHIGCWIHGPGYHFQIGN